VSSAPSAPACRAIPPRPAQGRRSPAVPHRRASRRAHDPRPKPLSRHRPRVGAASQRSLVRDLSRHAARRQAPPCSLPPRWPSPWQHRLPQPWSWRSLHGRLSDRALLTWYPAISLALKYVISLSNLSTKILPRRGELSRQASSPSPRFQRWPSRALGPCEQSWAGWRPCDWRTTRASASRGSSISPSSHGTCWTEIMSTASRAHRRAPRAALQPPRPPLRTRVP
jgi:hypothetical protein